MYRLDLTQEWRMRRWRRLLNLINRLALTRTSWLNDTMSQDDELAEYIVKNERRDASDKPTRRMRDYGASVELLSVIADRIAENTQVVAATKGAKGRRIEPMPRPDTAYARARLKKTRQHHSYTVARVFGYVDAKGNPTGREPKT